MGLLKFYSSFLACVFVLSVCLCLFRPHSTLFGYCVSPHSTLGTHSTAGKRAKHDINNIIELKQPALPSHSEMIEKLDRTKSIT